MPTYRTTFCKRKFFITNWKYILIIVILTALVGVGVFYQWQALKEETKIPEVKLPRKVTEDETADWKTYRNEEYKFEMKYPKELPVEQGGPLVQPNIFYFGGGPYETAISLMVSDISEKESVSISEKTEVTEIIVAGKKV